jgi:hypothetical protein
MYRLIIAVAIVMAFPSVVFAAEYFVAQDPATKGCKITDTKPDGSTAIMIGTSSYATKDEAKAARRAATECVKKAK